MNKSDNNASPLIILTGPTRGLGRALFEQFISHAYPIVTLGRDLSRVSSLVKLSSQPVTPIEVDFGGADFVLARALDSLRRLIQVSDIGSPLVLISNASIIEPIGQARSLELAGLEKALRINCLAPLMIANALAEIAQMQHRPLLIIDVSSGAACKPIRGWQAYCTSKAAHKMALDVLAAENSHVEVVHFDPGVMDTPMQQLIRDQQEADMPEVAAFRRYQDGGLLKPPCEVAAELIHLMRHHL